MLCWRAVYLDVQATEETVLYTAQAYIRAQQDQQQRETAQQQLAHLIRCPHLSLAWLTAALRSADGSYILEPFKEQVGMLLSFLHVQQGSSFSGSAFKAVAAPDTPASWYLGPRTSPSQGAGYGGWGRQPQFLSTTLKWDLPISDLKEACIKAAATSQTVEHSPHVSPPMRGVAYKVVATASNTDSGVQVGLYLAPYGLPAGMCCAYCAEITAGNKTRKFNHTTVCGAPWLGWAKFWTVSMPGGWDEATWTRRGLPAVGELTS